ncbi:MAG: GvpL/GvpF family gas vesicle protein [candidate division NC10 bacterium]|nr:GvpL/GvpF family gas vesicle protein [candidate division NC10 bacterium]
MEPTKAIYYLYGVIDHPGVQAVLEEIEMPCPVRCLPIGDLGALIRDVAMEEFGEDALRERMKDPKWLEQHIRQHARVLEVAMRFGTVIPMKFLTMFRSEERLLKSLLALDETLRELCGMLQGKEEWGVKVFCDLQCIQEAVEAQYDRVKELKAQLVGKPSGTAYLIRKQLEELVRRESGLRLAVHLESISCRVSSVAHDTKFNPAAQELGNRQMVLNASLLIDKTSASSLANEVNALRQEYLPRGFEFELVGPFPPYSFSELPVCAGQGETSRSEGAAHA